MPEPILLTADVRRNTVILVLSHVYNKDVRRLFRQIRTECSESYRIVFLCDNSASVFDAFKENSDCHLFTTAALQSLKYPGRLAIVYDDASRSAKPHHRDFNLAPGRADLPVLLYYRKNPSYDYYWIVEYDVRYSGDWSRFFSSFVDNDADLLGTTLTRYCDVPGWNHWPSLDVGTFQIGRDAYLRGFFPVYRLSNRALAQLDEAYRRGVKGHCEGVIPTILHHAGMMLEDIGGDGEFVRPENRNRFYRNTPATPSLAPGTFVFRPVIDRAGVEPDTLWHPVKYTPWWRIGLRWATRQIGRRLRGTA